ncbi:MAG TPA: hypothetical protein VLB02_01900 [Candidatus Paceibacterota bacterium]|nr:hypothetical protein [Candidatus Paceibacterota bacterium]
MNSALRYRLGIVLIIVFVAIGSFLLGTYTKGERGGDGIVLSCDPNTLQALVIPKSSQQSTFVAAASAVVSGSKTYFASKNGKKFYAAGCVSAQKRIKPENVIWFSTAEDATLQGFTEGSSC